MKRKMLVSAVGFICLFLFVVGGLGALFSKDNSEAHDLPPVAFNFPLAKEETRYSDLSHIYEYSLVTKKVTPHFVEGLEWLDTDMSAKLVLGRMGDVIVELNLTDDSIQELGPARYQDQPLEFVRRRPGAKDYCGITRSGKMVLWDWAGQKFTLLKTMSWNAFSFGCSWSGDGKRLHIPDGTGIGIIDMDTMEETHWLTIPVYYPELNNPGHGSYKNAFAVSPDQSTVVYCTEEKKMLLVKVNGSNSIDNVVELCEFNDDCGFDIAENNAVVFVCSKYEPFLFSHTAYEISLYQDGAFHRLKTTDWANNIYSGTYVFW